jgi:hypothetical protein
VGKFSLLLVEAVKVICFQFERRSYVQQVCGASTKFGGCLPRQLACPFEKNVVQWPELQSVSDDRACAADISLRKTRNPKALTTSSSPKTVTRHSPVATRIARVAAAELLSGL